MTNSKSTKRALWASVLSIVICLTMLIGSTFAWFTDTASTGTNKITAGNLDVKLYYNTDCGKTWNDAEKATDIFTTDKWEPGYTQVVYFKVENAGSLALDYKVATNIVKETKGVNQAGAEFALSDHLMFGFVDVTTAFADRNAARDAIKTANKFSNVGTAETRLASGASQTFAIVVWMPENTGNVANHNGIDKPEIQFGINVIASQADVESDSFNSEYDANASYPNAPKLDEIVAAPGTVEELRNILTTAFSGGSAGTITVNLTQDFDVNSQWEAINNTNYSGVNNVVINGNGHKISNLNEPLITGTFAGNGTFVVNDLTIENAKISVSGNYNNMGVGAIIGYIDSNAGAEFNNVTIKNSTIAATGTETCVGAIVGYNSTASADFNNCVVDTCTVTGTKYEGGIIGMTYGSDIKNCTVKNSTFTEGATYKGVVAAHCLANQSVFEGTTSTGNNISDLCGRNTVTPTIK